MTDSKLISKLGRMIESAEKIHVMNHDYGFNFNHNTLMQKLINADVIETPFWINPDDYFKCLISIDYFSSILFNCGSTLQNLELIFERMRNEKKDFELTAGVVSKELYLSAEDKLSEENLLERINGIKERYEKKNTKFNSAGKPSVYYRIIGEMVYDLVSSNYRKHLKAVKSLNDLRTLIFTDVMSGYTKISSNVKNYLSRGDFINASIELLNEINQSSCKDDDNYIKDIVKRFNEESPQTIATLINETKLSTGLIEKGLDYLINKNVIAKSETCKDGALYYLKYSKETTK